MYALAFDMVISDLQKYYGEPYNTLEDVKAGRVYHAKDAHDLIKQCLE